MATANTALHLTAYSVRSCVAPAFGSSSPRALNSPLCSGEQTFYSGLIASRTSRTSCPWDSPMAQVTLQGIFQASFPDYERTHPLPWHVRRAAYAIISLFLNYHNSL